MAQPIFGTATQQQLHDSPRPQVDSSGIFVLVVDDNNINRIICSRMLQKLGHGVATVCNGQEALEYLCRTSENPQPTIVFMDTAMPVVDGYAATRRIRSDADMFSARIRDVPIVGMAAHSMLGIREKCLEAGMDDLIAKPINLRTLHVAVLKWISPSGP